MLETKCGIKIIDLSTLTAESYAALKKKVLSLCEYQYMVTIPIERMQTAKYSKIFEETSRRMGCYSFLNINGLYAGFANDTYERIRNALYNTLHDKPKIYLNDE